MWRKHLHEEVGLFDTRYKSAGDWEFWIRCLTAGKKFVKINTPHVVYYQNPQGISTHPETRGVKEAHDILTRYYKAVVSPDLLLSREKFCEHAGTVFGRTDFPKSPTHYDLAQHALRQMGTQKTFAPSSQIQKEPIRILIDGVFFQLAQTGIARVWASLLQHLAQDPRLDILLLDRGHCPSIAGVTPVEFPTYNFSYTAADSLKIQEFCDRLSIDVFASTYYTTATRTPQVLLVYDMIPEVMKFDLNARAWREKETAILYASHFACISDNTKNDLLQFYPHLAGANVKVAKCGVDPAIFHPQDAHLITELRQKFELQRDYVLFVGSRDQHKGYKNAKLFFDALKKRETCDFDILCVGGEREIESGVRDGLPAGVTIMRIDLTDSDLAVAYAGALALVYPSLYEGFGMPVAEAMASGCPVITTQHGSLREVAGDAAFLISGFEADEMNHALDQVRLPQVRGSLIAKGLERAKLFSWQGMAEEVKELLWLAKSARTSGPSDAFHEGWHRLRRMQCNVDVGID
jgi:glycosyltransferase involved in cell wall biosynthesis